MLAAHETPLHLYSAAYDKRGSELRHAAETHITDWSATEAHPDVKICRLFHPKRRQKENEIERQMSLRLLCGLGRLNVLCTVKVASYLMRRL